MKIGLFFGAGAEIGYGLPSGGKFAIDLFREDPSVYKTNLRKLLKNLDSRSSYANNWLPQGYADKSIYAFGRNEFTSIIESSIEYNREEIIRRLNSFDKECDQIINELGIGRESVEDKFSEITGNTFGERTYTQNIRLNELLSRDVKLFESEYYSGMLDLIKTEEETDDLRRYVTSFLQLLVGAHGQALVQRLNQELFEAAPDDLPIFDDISGMFKLEFNRVGSTALELLLEEHRCFDTSQSATAISIFCAIAQKFLENLFTTVLDYQKLIDDHFRYLFSPKTEWAKFTRMVIFLNIARDYISAKVPNVSQNSPLGYYHDLRNLTDDVEISAVGTANYNSILNQVAESIGLQLPQVQHLNGSTSDYYNPYKNSVISSDSPDAVPSEQIHVPFILTQSGIKPLTSVTMSRRYVQLFDAFRNSDAIVVVGFGFHKDDSHINGLFRELIESEGKPLYWVNKEADGTAQDQQRNLLKKLRLSQEHRNLVKVIPVNADSRLIGNQSWLEYVTLDLLV